MYTCLIIWQKVRVAALLDEYHRTKQAKTEDLLSHTTAANIYEDIDRISHIQEEDDFEKFLATHILIDTNTIRTTNTTGAGASGSVTGGHNSEGQGYEKAMKEGEQELLEKRKQSLLAFLY